MQLLLLWNSIYWQAQFTRFREFLLVALFVIGGLVVLLAVLIKLLRLLDRMAKPTDATTPVVVRARLSWFERLLLLAVLLSFIVTIWQKQ